MRIFYSFLIILTSTIFLFLDVPQAVYDFRTKVREDNFTISTAVGVTSANVTLLRAIYEDDTATVSFTSNITEVPAVNTYNGTSRQLEISGLSANVTRLLLVSYDTTSLSGALALNTFLNVFPYFWIVLMIAFIASAIAYMWVGN